MRTITVAALCAVLGAGCGEVPGPERRDVVEDTTYVLDAAASDSAKQAALAWADERLERMFAGYPPQTLARIRPDTSGVAHWADSVLAGMTLRQRAAQLVLADLPGHGVVLTRNLERAIEEGVGGLLMPRAIDPVELREAIVRMQSMSPVPMFMAADFERGVGRFDNALTELPANMAIGATRDTVLAAAAGRLTAIESRAVGVNLLLAPVADVNLDPANPIINVRAYGDRAHEVAAFAACYSDEAEQWGVLTTFKHYPGHGNTDTDSHSRLATIRMDVEALEVADLLPYSHALQTRRAPAAVMTGHVWTSAFDRSPLPATFSRAAIRDYLRGRLGFDGLVLTDDIRMGALAADHSFEERVLRSIEAGVDVIVGPDDPREAIRLIVRAVESGRIDSADVAESAARVLRAKAAAGLHNERGLPAGILAALTERPYGQPIADSIAAASITRISGDVVWPSGAQVLHLANLVGSESVSAAMDSVDVWLGAGGSSRYFHRLPESERTGIVGELALEGGPGVVILLYQRLSAGRGDAGLLEGHRDLVRDLIATGVPVHVLSLGNPYEVPHFGSAASILVGYDQSIATARAAVAVGMGRIDGPGQLPVLLGK